MRNRAYRRHKKHVKFLKRLNKWNCRLNNKEKAQVIKESLDGESWTVLRTTGTPCSCYGCSYPKYERPSKSEVNQIIQEHLDDFDDCKY